MTQQNRSIGIEFISVFGLPPVEFVTLAAGLGCAHIGTGLAPMAGNPHEYPDWSLRDAAQRREAVAAMRDTGVTISLGEGFLVRPGADVADFAADLDAMVALGAPVVNILTLDPDKPRGVDQLAAFADMAEARGMQATLEYIPGMAVGDLPGALEAIRQVGRANFRLMIDPMHLFRSGATVADIAAIPADLIGYVQFCDVPLVSKFASYADEARFERLRPGDGELPLRDMLDVLPAGHALGLEVPMRALAESGVGPRERLAPSVAATRAMIARAD